MSQPTHPCGCAGVWTVSVIYSGYFPPDSENVAGYENDAPYFAVDNPVPGGNYNLYSGCDGRMMRYGWLGYGVFTLSITSATFTKTDPNCNSNSPFYDCVNGACILSTNYGTPGIYQSLSECEESCGIGCSGKCISNSDWATIEQLAKQHLNKDCA